MSLIGKQIGDFKVNAFHNGDITEVSKESTLSLATLSLSTRHGTRSPSVSLR